MAQLTHVDELVNAIERGAWRTRDLVRLSHALAQRGANTTSILGQYGEELVARAFEGTVASNFAQKAYDVETPEHGQLQVKTYSTGKRAGSIRSFEFDVVTVCVNPQTASVISARHFSAADLYNEFRIRHAATYAQRGLYWNGRQDGRFDRGWTIASSVPYVDVTDRLRGAEGHQ